MSGKVFVIAEAGVNHNGDLEQAKRLIQIAVEAKADAVKFQTFNASLLATKYAEKAEYQKISSKENTQLEMLKKLELSADDHVVLMDYCKERNIQFLSTPFDHKSINLLHTLGLKIFKLPSGEITNLPYLRHVGSLGKKIIISTGMSTMNEVAAALELLVEAGTRKKDIVVLHTTTAYPCPIEEVNLLAMKTIENELGVKVGYSDHTTGIEVAIAATALGASVIEKHFTISRDLPGPDHKSSLEPEELAKMISAIRLISKALGDGQKIPSKSEMKNQLLVRKSIVAKNFIKKGEFLTENNLTVKRPGSGISPMKWEEIVGRKAVSDFEPDQIITI